MNQLSNQKQLSTTRQTAPSIIAITGMPFSGKSTLAQIAEEHGYTRVRLGDAIINEMKKRGIPRTNRNVREFSTEIREGNRGVAAELAIPAIEEALQHGKKVVIDGVRSPEEIDILRDRFGDDVLLKCVTAPEEDRWERATERDREDDDFESFDDFKWNDRQQIEWGLDETIEKADLIIPNREGLSDFRDRAQQLLSDLQDDSPEPLN